MKDGHQNPDPKTYSYKGILLWGSIEISLTYDSLNGIYFLEVGIRNAYLQSQVI